MKKADMLQQMMTWIEYIHNVTKYTPVKLGIPSEEPMKADANSIQDGYKWLKFIISTTYQPIWDLYRQNDPSYWEKLFTRDERELREMDLMRKLIKDLKKSLKTKPEIFTRKNWKHEQTEGSHVREKVSTHRKSHSTNDSCSQ